jgi:hypothetical protein
MSIATDRVITQSLVITQRRIPRFDRKFVDSAAVRELGLETGQERNLMQERYFPLSIYR